MIVQEEAYPLVLAEVLPLTVEHWQEHTVHKENNSLSPDFGQYNALYNAGMLKVITAREDGEVVGYSAWILQKALHHSHSIHATSDLIFLKKEYRKGIAGYKIVKQMIEIMKGSGAAVVHIGDGGNPALGKILGRMGLEQTQVTYEMRII